MSAFLQGLFDGSVNLSIASLPLTLVLSALPHWYTIYKAETNKVQGGWANENPRAFVARLNAKAAAGKQLTELEEMILRGQAAQQNGFEWWAVWAVAVAFGYITRIPTAEMNRHTFLHIACRVIYNYLYISTSKRSSSYLRTLVFQISVYPAVAVFVKAATQLN